MILFQGKNRRVWKTSLLTVFLSNNILSAIADTSPPDWFVENEIDFSAIPASLMQPMETKPDLIITEVDITEMKTDIQTLNISGHVGVTINNIGDAVAAPALVTVFEDTNRNGIFDEGIDNKLGSQTMSANFTPYR